MSKLFDPSRDECRAQWRVYDEVAEALPGVTLEEPRRELKALVARQKEFCEERRGVHAERSSGRRAEREAAWRLAHERAEVEREICRLQDELREVYHRARAGRTSETLGGLLEALRGVTLIQGGDDA